MSVFRTIAGIAQLGERQTEDLKVTGSIPVGGKAKLEPYRLRISGLVVE